MSDVNTWSLNHGIQFITNEIIIFVYYVHGIFVFFILMNDAVAFVFVYQPIII